MSGVEFVPHEAAPPGTQAVPPYAEPPLEEHLPGSADEPRRRRGLGPRSLTARLVTGVASLVIVLVLGIAIGTYYELRSYLVDQLDHQLANTSSQPLHELLDTNSYDPSAQPIWMIELDTGGKVLDRLPKGGPVRHMQLTPVDRIALSQPVSSPRTVTTTDGVQLRVVAAPQPSVVGVIVIGLSTEGPTKTLHRLVVLELVIGAAAVLLALLATSYGVRFSLRRLRRVTSTAHEVAAELSPSGAGLDRRVDVPDDGTEVGQLAASMNTLLSAVETQFAARLESEQRLRQFLADASHELRTPLTSIRGYAELARMQRAAGADADDNLSRIESEGTRMSRLVEDLLTLARGDQASAEPARELVDVGELVEDAVRDTRAAFPDRPVQAQPAHGLHIIGDHDQLLRAVRNLMANAAVHTAKGGPILVRSAPDGDSVVIQVIDAGPGLPPDEAAHVFERFWRADKARTRARGGSGLGLSIVSSIVAAHGGTVRFDSAVETGSTVTIRLPAVAY